MATEPLNEKLDRIQGSLDRIGKDLGALQNANRVHRVKFWAVWIIAAGLLGLTAYVGDTTSDARNELEQRFEQSQMRSCENSQQSRENIRGVFGLFLTLAAEQSDNPAAVQQFTERFNEELIEALPDRDCEQEAADRERAQ